MQSGNQFNWWYLYAFRTEDGRHATGKIVLESPRAFSTGDRITVVYVATDPGDNRHADELMPRSYRDWFFLAMSALLLGSSVLRLCKDLASYRALLRLSRAGWPVPGEVVKAQLDAARINELVVSIHYLFRTPEGMPIEARAEVSLTHLAHRAIPKPRSKIAVWCASEGAVLI